MTAWQFRVRGRQFIIVVSLVTLWRGLRAASRYRFMTFSWHTDLRHRFLSQHGLPVRFQEGSTSFLKQVSHEPFSSLGVPGGSPLVVPSAKVHYLPLYSIERALHNWGRDCNESSLLSPDRESFLSLITTAKTMRDEGACWRLKRWFWRAREGSEYIIL